MLRSLINGILDGVHQDHAAVGGAGDCIDTGGLLRHNSPGDGLFNDLALPGGKMPEDLNALNFPVFESHANGGAVGTGAAFPYVDSVINLGRFDGCADGPGKLAGNESTGKAGAQEKKAHGADTVFHRLLSGLLAF